MLDEVPSGWALKKQGEVAQFVNGRAYKLTEWEKEGTPVIRLQNLTGSGKEFYYSNLKLPDHQYCEAGDLLYMWSASFGPHYWHGPKAIFHYHIWKVVNDPNLLDRDFLFHLLTFETESFKRGASGMAMLHLTKKGMEQTGVLLPPLAEQKRIAEILTSVDDTIRATEAVIAQTERVKLGVMEDLLTGGLGSDAIANGEVPVGWEVRKLGDFAKAKGGKRMPKGRPFSDEPTPHAYIRVTDFNDGTIAFAGLKYVLPEDQKQIARYTISKDDVYISIAGSIGIVGLVPSKLDGAQLTENAAKIVIEDQSIVTKEYLAAVLTSKFGQDQIAVKKGVGGGVPKLALFRIEELLIPLPPADDQQHIMKALIAFDDQLAANKGLLSQTKRLKQGLMSDLLTGKKRVV